MLHLYTGSLLAGADSDSFRLHEAYLALRAALDSEAHAGERPQPLELERDIVDGQNHRRRLRYCFTSV